MKLIDGKLISSICSVQTLFDCDGRTQHAWHGTFVPRSASLYLVAVVAAEVVIVEQVFVEHAHVRLWLSTVLHCRYPCCLGVCCIRRRIRRRIHCRAGALHLSLQLRVQPADMHTTTNRTDASDKTCMQGVHQWSAES